MTTTIRLDTREMDRIIQQSGLKALQVVNRLAFQIEADAKQRAPYETGALMNSGFTEPAKESNRMGWDYAVVGFTMEYAPYQEFGTYKMAAHPYLWPAIEAIIGEFNSGNTWKEVVE